MQKKLNKLQPFLDFIINTKKTVTVYQPSPGQTATPHGEIYGTPLKSVKNFTYLGSTIASDNTIDVEINNRIRAASGAFEGLWKHAWSQHGITVSTKRKVYKCFQHYCTQRRHTLSIVATLENIPKCISEISCECHGKTTFQMMKS